MSSPNATLIDAYSEALFQSGLKAGNLMAVETQTLMLEDLIGKDARLKAFIEAPNIARDAKEDLFDRVFGPRVEKLLINFMKLLIRRGRLDILLATFPAFRKRAAAQRGELPATVVTATALSAEEAAKLQTALNTFTGKKLKIEYKLAPELIGGIRFQCGDTLIDTSLALGLERLRTELLHTQVH